ncbi:hypothetical protein L873DRAFT_1844439 [Choiromyces venosus 120613-1]|uniref:Uncharacterized protein n=1 Tax=Choiromyces venosus 120613-1 TaxID=1336337 RepID=A0A3N4JIF7_9PEZI|nr:hypothetical protein L873DRAFT_1844439 [Choiromyces venosus 120613-1]
MPDLRAALKLPSPKPIDVNGTLYGSDLWSNGTMATCQYYIDTSPVRSFNFTIYVLSLSATYKGLVKAGAAAGEVFEGRNASEYAVMLGRQNGWRGQAQNV